MCYVYPYFLSLLVGVIYYFYLILPGTRWGLGGTCVNVGCVPKKVMFNAANFLEDSMIAQKGYGLFTGGAARDYTTPLQIEWSILKESRDAYIKRLNGIYASHIDNAGIDLIKGTAKFVDKKIVECGDQRGTA